ncbi:MAG TPA: xanthine dehydrogenase family protein molybdopterin-binding subunit [Candidatus Saccharimonadales bacterium]|nr:xanthine dehydrogenase family protein molybdopterin-binding subunit [Candidatus Saccharimonadales bacterium]
MAVHVAPSADGSPTEEQRGGIGDRVLRKEDKRLLAGRARFVADVHLPGMLHAVVVRSPFAHARILSIDASAAFQVDGVITVVTAQDLPADLPPIPLRTGTERSPLRLCLQQPLAKTVVRYVGEPVAVVIATDRYVAEDAAQEVVVDYENLGVAASIDAALAEGAPVIHEALGSNVGFTFQQRVGDAERAMAGADVVIDATFNIPRLTAVPLECRGLVAEWDGRDGRITVWGMTKVPHFNRGVLARMLGVPDADIHFMATDVGGGFGVRGEFYPEDFLIPFLAVRLGRPVSWIEDRREHMLAINHSREQRIRVRLGADRHGKIQALQAWIDNDHGAYARTHGGVVAVLTSALLLGPYRIANYSAEVRSIMTNKTPTGTYRGPGRYEGSFARERLIDMLAHKVGVDAAEIRKRNFIAASELPYDTGLHLETSDETLVYDSGDYAAELNVVLRALDYETAKQERERAQSEGRLVGIGLASFVEKSGNGPFEYARVEVDTRGAVQLFSGGASLGQGVETVLAQIVSSSLSVPFDAIDVIHGDTDRVPFGIGGWGSRVTSIGGSAAMLAAQKVRQKALDIASHLLEVAIEDLEMANGIVWVRGMPNRKVPLGEIAAAALPGGRLPPGVEPFLRAEHVHSTTHESYPSGAHGCIVEVDGATGKIAIRKYVMAYDIGRAVNPLLVEGQLQGGLAQGIGGAMLEELVYDEEGQLRTGTFMDYLLPTSMEVPDADIHLMEYASPINPLGTKGAGEGGITPVGGCIANAVTDALAPFGVELTRLPLAPAVVRAAIKRTSEGLPTNA